MEDSIGIAHGEDGTAVVSVRGEIDYSNSAELAQGIREAVAALGKQAARSQQAALGEQAVHIDLADATFIDSTGLGALIEGYHAAERTGCAFKVTNPGVEFQRVLEITGLTDLFGLGDEDGRAALSQASGS